jgi:tetratricopeptide (TPR) repeat protein
MPMPWRAASWAGLLLLAAAAPPEHAETGLPPRVGKPLQAAQALIAQHKFDAALLQIKKAEAAGPLSPEAIGVAEQLRGLAAQGAGDTAAAAASFEKAIDTGKLAPPDRQRLILAEASLAYAQKDYAKTIAWAQRYQSEGGKDEAARTLLAQAYYQNGDWAGAARTLNEQIAAGVTLDEPQLRLLADSALKQSDSAGYQAALERLAVAYPQPEYWSALLQRVRLRPDFPNRLVLDVFRLSQAVGVPSTPAQYTDAAEVALENGLPGEAKAILDQGFTSGVLGTGPQAARQGRLRAMAAQQATEDLKTLGQHATAGDGPGLVKVGLDYLGQGQSQTSVSLIQQGLAKGGLTHPDEARLHLGVAYYVAGQKDQAIAAFQAVHGGAEAELAKLWLLHFNNKSS